MYTSLLYLSLFFLCSSAELNNECENFHSYIWKYTSKYCYYNKDMSVLMPKLAVQNDYPVKTIETTTKDGYILKMFRMEQVARARKGVVFLLHPATAACDVWADKGNVSLGRFLYDEGYEVWLGNARGVSYSRNHTSLNPDKDSSFWDFSYHEMGIYDIPAAIDTVRNVSEADKVAFVGHSMGCTSAVIYASLLPEHAKKSINIFVLLAPPVYFKHTLDLLKIASKYERLLYFVGSLLGLNELLQKSWLMQTLTRICYSNMFGMIGCSLLLQTNMGFNIGQMYAPYLAAAYSHNTDAVSLKSLVHYMQAVNSGFRQFDYGPTQNLKKYNSTSPPLYPISNINVPMHLVAGSYDIICNYLDVKQFYDDLRNNSGNYLDVVGFNHMDFLYGKDIDVYINIRIKNLFAEKVFIL